MGEGTKILACKQSGSFVDILGPLGNGFNLEDDYETAVFVAGGMGSAPFPYLTRKVKDSKKIISFVGGRSKNDLITYSLMNVHTSTDDGSEGFNGNIVQLLEKNLDKLTAEKIKIFGCGPNAMLKSLKDFCLKYDFNCEISTESAMACGFGICQGCPIESAANPDRYLLVCKDGPVFNSKDVVL